MLNPPSMYRLLPVTAKPPGRIVPAASPGQLSPLVSVVSRVGDRVIEEHARCSCGLPSCRAAHAVDIRSARDGKHATGHVVHLVIGQGHTHLGPAVDVGE